MSSQKFCLAVLLGVTLYYNPAFAQLKSVPEPLIHTPPSADVQEPRSPMRVHSKSTTYQMAQSSGLSQPLIASSSNSFSDPVDPGAIDVGAASDGTYIVTTTELGLINTYAMSGTRVQSRYISDYVCTTSHLPICNGTGGPGDSRVVYDPFGKRWVISALWFQGPPPVQGVLLVSQTSNPTGAWYGYQFPACGAADTWDASDQPHLGFNAQWIVVTSACSCQGGVNGAGLAWFDKANLYAGGTLPGKSGNLIDGYSGGPYCNMAGTSADNSRDEPVRTYTTPLAGREYLVSAFYDTKTGNAEMVYGHLQGPTDAPILSSPTETVVTGFPTTGSAGADIIPEVATPSCPGCLISSANGWIHSAGLCQAPEFKYPVIISTMTAGATDFANQTQIISVAGNTGTGAATALQVKGVSAGDGPMASEIAMPLVSSANYAIIGYDTSNSSFIPGVRYLVWAFDTNTMLGAVPLVEGSYVPQFSNCANESPARWVDFLDAAQPVGNNGLLLGGTYGYPNFNFGFDSECATSWNVLRFVP